MDDNNIKGAKSNNYVNDLYLGTSEKTFEESAFVEKSQYKPFNSDDLYQKAGDYSIYEEMLEDDQVSVALQLKKDLIIGSGFDIVGQEEGQDDIVDDLNQALFNDVCPSFQELLEEIISAYEFGFSITEKIFKTRDDGTLTLNTLKTRHPNTWLIDTDVRGNIEEIRQQGVENDVVIDPRSVIHYVNNRKFQNAFGRSDLRSCYQAYFTKRHIIRYYSIFLEKSASPTPIARFDKSVPDATVTKIFNIIKKFQARTAMTIPKDVEIEFLESKSNGEAFIRGINMFNMFIGRALTIPDLIGLQGSDTSGGSQALSREQMKIFAMHIKRRRHILEGVINQHIIKPIVLFNHGDVLNPPVFQFKPFNDEDSFEYAKIFLEAVKGRVYEPSDEEINHFRSLIKFPEGEVERKEEPAAPAPIESEENVEVDGDVGADNPETGEEETEIDKTKEPEQEKDTFVLNEELSERSDGGFDDVEGDFKDKVDFKAINGLLDNTVGKISTETTPLVDDLVESIIDQIQKKKILEKKNLGAVNSLKIKNLKPMQLSLKKGLRGLFNDGQKVGMNEIFQKDTFAQPLLPAEFLAVLEAETFDAIGKWEFTFKEDVKLAMQQAIKDGKPLSSVISEIEGAPKAKMSASIDRFARTKSTEVLNKARLAVFDESTIVNGYQYSAVLDGRTTDICAGLHGKQFAKGTEPVPPLHFNCRSMLIPITKFEKLKPDTKVGGTVKTRRAGDIKIPKKSIDQHIKDNIGKGFSVK